MRAILAPLFLAPLFLARVLLALPAAAQGPPACTAAREGMAACFADRLCECRWQPGGSVAGRPAGHRWDCGPLRPACGTVPPGPVPEPAPYPFTRPYPMPAR